MLSAALIGGCGGSGNGAGAGWVSSLPSPTTAALESSPPPPPACTAGSVDAIVDGLVAEGMTIRRASCRFSLE